MFFLLQRGPMDDTIIMHFQETHLDRYDVSSETILLCVVQVVYYINILSISVIVLVTCVQIDVTR